MSSACDPLAPLQRWVTYTQNEVLQLKRELYEHKQEVANVYSNSWTVCKHRFERVSNAWLS